MIVPRIFIFSFFVSFVFILSSSVEIYAAKKGSCKLRGPKDFDVKVTDFVVTLLWTRRSCWKKYNVSYVVEACLMLDPPRCSSNISWMQRTCEIKNNGTRTYCSLQLPKQFYARFRVMAVLQENGEKETRTKYKRSQPITVARDSNFTAPRLNVVEAEKDLIRVHLSAAVRMYSTQYSVQPVKGRRSDDYCRKDKPDNFTLNLYPSKTVDVGDEKKFLLVLKDLASDSEYCIQAVYRVNAYTNKWSGVGFLRVKTQSDPQKMMSLIGIILTVAVMIVLTVSCWKVITLMKTFKSFVYRDIPKFLNDLHDELTSTQSNASNGDDCASLLPTTLLKVRFTPPVDENPDSFPDGLFNEDQPYTEDDTPLEDDVTSTTSLGKDVCILDNSTTLIVETSGNFRHVTEVSTHDNAEPDSVPTDDVIWSHGFVDDVTVDDKKALCGNKRPASYLRIVSVDGVKPSRISNETDNGYAPR